MIAWMLLLRAWCAQRFYPANAKVLMQLVLFSQGVSVVKNLSNAFGS
jgi:hypothetical protein